MKRFDFFRSAISGAAAAAIAPLAAAPLIARLAAPAPIYGEAVLGDALEPVESIALHDVGGFAETPIGGTEFQFGEVVDGLENPLVRATTVMRGEPGIQKIQSMAAQGYTHLWTFVRTSAEPLSRSVRSFRIAGMHLP